VHGFRQWRLVIASADRSELTQQQQLGTMRTESVVFPQNLRLTKSKNRTTIGPNHCKPQYGRPSGHRAAMLWQSKLPIRKDTAMACSLGPCKHARLPSLQPARVQGSRLGWSFFSNRQRDDYRLLLAVEPAHPNVAGHLPLTAFVKISLARNGPNR
jgi:hypothetical protein